MRRIDDYSQHLRANRTPATRLMFSLCGPTLGAVSISVGGGATILDHAYVADRSDFLSSEAPTIPHRGTVAACFGAPGENIQYSYRSRLSAGICRFLEATGIDRALGYTFLESDKRTAHK